MWYVPFIFTTYNTKKRGIPRFRKLFDLIQKTTYYNSPKVGALACYPWGDKKVKLRRKQLLKLTELNPELSPHSLRTLSYTHTYLLAEAARTNYGQAEAC